MNSIKRSHFLSEYPRSFTVLTIISLVSLSIFLLVKLSISGIIKTHPETIFILVFLGSAPFQPWLLKRDIGIRLLGISILLPLILFFFNYLSNAELAVEYFSIEKIVKLTSFLAIGFWIGGSVRNLYVFLTVVFMGLLVALFNVDVIEAFNSIFRGERVDFFIRNAQHTAMFFGLAIIGFLSFYKDLITSKYPSGVILLLSILFFVGLIISVIVFIGTQTRAALLALDILFIISVVSLTIKFFKKRFSKKLSILFLLYVFSSSIALYHASSLALNKRGAESAVTEELYKGSLNDIPMSSLGIRINTWIVASKWIAQKPLQGWGGKVRQHVIQQSNLPDKIKDRFGHFHNSYIEFTLAYGISGLAFIIFLFAWMNRRIYLLSRENQAYISVWYFTFYGSLFMAIINIFESFVFFGTGVYATGVLLAPAYSLHLSSLYKEHS